MGNVMNSPNVVFKTKNPKVKGLDPYYSPLQQMVMTYARIAYLPTVELKIKFAKEHLHQITHAKYLEEIEKLDKLEGCVLKEQDGMILYSPLYSELLIRVVDRIKQLKLYADQNLLRLDEI